MNAAHPGHIERTSPRARLLASVTSWLLLGFAAVLLDVFLGYRFVSPWASVGLVGLAWALYVLMGGARERVSLGVSLVASLALCLVLARWPDGQRRDFARAVQAIVPGMRLEQVDAVLAGFRRGHLYGEEFGAPEWTYWHSGDAEWDYDHCRVRCGDGGEVRAIELVLD